MPRLNKQNLLNQLYQKLEKTEDIVPGEGFINAEILFIGEAPGKHEVIECRPFVGRSGKFFRKTLIEEAGILESEVYISNIVKVRPPENRDPTKKEIEAFKSTLDKEIEIIQPKLIITLGRFSMAKFLRDVKISQVHGKLHRVKWPVVGDLFVLPMYHPAAGLRSSKMRQAFIDDFKKIPKIIDWMEKQKEVKGLKDSAIEHLF